MKCNDIRIAALRACLVTLACAGCGGSRHASRQAEKEPVAGSPVRIACQPAGRAAVGRFLHMPTSTVSESGSQGNNGFPQCSFEVALSGRAHVEIVTNVDNGPSPYFILERTAIEAAQQFTAQRISPAPESITGLGLEADWFPAYPQRLMATDGKLLITTSVTWPGASQRRDQALAVAITRPYLHTPHGKAAIAVAEGYP